MNESDIEILKEGNANSEFISENLNKLEREYKGQIIAVKKCEVIAHAKNMDTLLKEIEDEPLSHILIVPIPSGETAWIL